ncbi:cyclin-dependent kinase 1-A-like [Pocillopora verrucosa]|uniref:cyclin-dependent kinase 1-A-like n=1 Tax=Pocillopora verrucosa TaxID=203993 RepID=UPI003341600E
MKTNQPFSWRKNTPKERAAMQNDRRKRKRKARAANKEDKRRKALLALEDERAMTVAKNERLLHLARKYYAKWHALHLRERTSKMDKSNTMENEKQAHKDAPVSADQPVSHVKRSHLSHVKDPSGSTDQPLLLGCGVFGRCYKMNYRGISVAVKQFNTHLSSESSVIKEASLMKQLDHPCFPYVYGVCVQSKPYLLVLQFCNVEGKAYTLHRTLHSRTLVLKNQEWFDVILQLLEALKVLHNSGLIHQDIKGDNILLTYKNTLFVPVIIDFGKCIRKQEASRKVLSKQEQETYKQKYTHVTPEVVAGTHPPSHASDVYALGQLLRQIATKIGCKPLLSLSECSLKNDPNARASLDHLLVSVKSLSS